MPYERWQKNVKIINNKTIAKFNLIIKYKLKKSSFNIKSELFDDRF
jgi:hypothetical protein